MSRSGGIVPSNWVDVVARHPADALAPPQDHLDERLRLRVVLDGVFSNMESTVHADFVFHWSHLPHLMSKGLYWYEHHLARGGEEMPHVASFRDPRGVGFMKLWNPRGSRPQGSPGSLWIGTVVVTTPVDSHRATLADFDLSWERIREAYLDGVDTDRRLMELKRTDNGFVMSTTLMQAPDCPHGPYWFWPKWRAGWYINWKKGEAETKGTNWWMQYLACFVDSYIQPTKYLQNNALPRVLTLGVLGDENWLRGFLGDWVVTGRWGNSWATARHFVKAALRSGRYRSCGVFDTEYEAVVVLLHFKSWYPAWQKDAKSGYVARFPSARPAIDWSLDMW